MVQKLIEQNICDLCDHLEMSNIPGVVTHFIKLDDGPLKRYDHCEHSERMLGWVLNYLREHGQEVPPPLPAPAKPQKAKAAAGAPKTKELEKKPATAEEPPAKVWCPLPHEQEHGAGKFVTYKGRGQHAKSVHNRLEVWDIEWMDPHKILKVPCTAHEKCMKTGLAFESEHGLATHIIKCPLPRIDTTDDTPDE